MKRIFSLMLSLMLLFPGRVFAEIITDPTGHQIFRQDYYKGEYIFRLETDLTTQQQLLLNGNNIGPILSYSIDNGKTWIAIKVNVNEYVVSPNFDKDHTIYVNADNRLLVTRDAGNKFYPVDGLPSEARVAFSPDYSSDNTLYAYNPNTGGAFYRSINKGQNWETTDPNQLSPNPKHFPYTVVDVAPGKSGLVWTLVTDSAVIDKPNYFIYSSNDYGKTFKQVSIDQYRSNDSYISAKEIFEKAKTGSYGENFGDNQTHKINPLPPTVIEFVLGQYGYTVNGALTDMDATTFTDNGRTLVPIRYLCQSIGAKILWDDATQTATLSKGNQVVTLTVGSKILTSLSGPVTMDTGPMYKDGRIYLPARYVCEAFSYRINWDENAKSLIIQ